MEGRELKCGYSLGPSPRRLHWIDETASCHNTAVLSAGVLLYWWRTGVSIQCAMYWDKDSLSILFNAHANKQETFAFKT